MTEPREKYVTRYTKEYGFTLTEMAQKLGCSVSKVRKYDKHGTLKDKLASIVKEK